MALGSPWQFPPFPVSCPFRLAVAPQEVSPLTDPTEQIFRSGFLKPVSPS